MRGRRFLALAGLVAATLVLRLTGRGPLGVPLGSLDRFDRWIHHTSAPVMALALVRLFAVVACGYLTLVWALLLVADAAGWRRTAAGLARCLPAALRGGLAWGAQVGLTAGVVLGPSSAVAASPRASPSAAGEPPATATMWSLGPTGIGGGPMAEPPATATMVLLEPVDPPATGAPPTGAPATDPPAPAVGAASGPPAAVAEPSTDPAAATSPTGTWIVAGGDSFWSIAAAVLADQDRSREPEDREVAGYWSRLIGANRDRLVAPAHPDLLIPGQVLVLPVPSPAGAPASAARGSP